MSEPRSQHTSITQVKLHSRFAPCVVSFVREVESASFHCSDTAEATGKMDEIEAATGCSIAVNTPGWVNEAVMEAVCLLCMSVCVCPD